MSKTKLGLVVTSSFLILGCAAKKVDTTPKNLTSVLQAEYAINGGFTPDLHGKQTVYTRSDRRRIHNKVEFDSFMMGWANYDQSDIFRMDKKLLNFLDHDNETYAECPLAGCISGFEQLMQKGAISSESDESESDDSEYQSYDSKGCQVNLTKNEFKVLATGNERNIAGLDAKEYSVSWTTEFEDSNKKVDKNVFRFVFWTTSPTAEINQAWEIQKTATDNYLKAVGDDNALVKLLGKEGYKAISALSGDIEKSDEDGYGAFLRDLSKIEGYPLSIKFEWFQKNDACKHVEEKSGSGSGMDLTGGIEGAALSFAGDFISKQTDKLFSDWKKEPRIRYVYEVKTIEQEMLHDSVFDVPVDYKLMDRQ